MKKIIAIGMLLLVPQIAAARVYMCVDHETGETSFTDKACESAATREEVRVDPANLESGKGYARRPAAKTWSSEADRRKSGLQYNEDRRSIYNNSTASVD